MANYSILELERIEKILGAKYKVAAEMYDSRLNLLHRTFKEKLNGSGEAHSYDASWLKREWDRFQEADEKLMAMKSEVDLFQRAMDALYSYWDHAVEVFIDNMRERVTK
jgi:2-hydroxychromene-2-carboxylate isomerase